MGGRSWNRYRIVDFASANVGTSITLHLKPNYTIFAEDEQLVEDSIKQYADFLPIPYLSNDSKARVNLIQAACLSQHPIRSRS